MCRLAYVPFKTEKEDVDIIGTLFQFLEMSFGGHGNGIGYFEDHKPWFYKGANLSTDTLADHMVDKALSSIFHTRLASMGSICDSNCHPFAYNGVLTAHNGHWSDAEEMARMLIHADKFSNRKITDMTDSEVIACLVGNYGFGAADIVNTGVILSLYQDHAKVYVKGDFEVILTPEGRWLYASEFPRKIIEEWNVDYYRRFERGSVAKLTDSGPILVEGKLTKTTPSAWPTYKRGGGTSRYSIGYEDLYGERFTKKTDEPKHKQERLSFLPKRKGKKGKRKPYYPWEILVQVEEHIGFDDNPDVDAIASSTIHMELSDALDELEVELGIILSSNQDRRWMAQECNDTVLTWLSVNRLLLSEYDELKSSLETSFGFSNQHGDSYVCDYGNLWVNFHGEWKLYEDLTDEEKQDLFETGASEWDYLNQEL